MIIVLIQTCLAKSLTLTKAQIESQHDEAEQQEYHKGELQDGEQNDDEDSFLHMIFHKKGRPWVQNG